MYPGGLASPPAGTDRRLGRPDSCAGHLNCVSSVVTLLRNRRTKITGGVTTLLGQLRCVFCLAGLSKDLALPRRGEETPNTPEPHFRINVTQPQANKLRQPAQEPAPGCACGAQFPSAGPGSVPAFALFEMGNFLVGPSCTSELTSRNPGHRQFKIAIQASFLCAWPLCAADFARKRASPPPWMPESPRAAVPGTSRWNPDSP